MKIFSPTLRQGEDSMWCISAFATPILCDRCLEYGLFVIPRSSCTSVIGFFVQQRFFGVNGKGGREDAGKYASLYQTLDLPRLFMRDGDEI